MPQTIERTEAIRAPQKAERPRLSRSEMQAKARSVVLGAAALFVLAQVGLRGVIEEARPELRDPTFEIKCRRFAALKSQVNPAPASVLFMGSSMTVFGANAAAVDGPASLALGRPVVAYNLGVAGSGPFTQLLFLQRLLRRGAKPDFVVLELSGLCFSHEDPFGEMKHFPGQMLSRHDLDTVTRYSSNPDEVYRDWLAAYLVPVHGHRLTIVSQTAHVFVPWNDRLELWDNLDDHGWRRMATPSPDEHARVLTNVKKTFEPQIAQYQVGQSQRRALRELSGLLEKERIPTILVWMPEGPLMRSFYSSEAAQSLQSEFERASKEHGFPLVNARGWLEEDAFWDSVHMTEAGGSAFTERLVREAIVPWLQISRTGLKR
jgi:hypothetical protein